MCPTAAGVKNMSQFFITCLPDVTASVAFLLFYIRVGCVLHPTLAITHVTPPEGHAFVPSLFPISNLECEKGRGNKSSSNNSSKKKEKALLPSVMYVGNIAILLHIFSSWISKRRSGICFRWGNRVVVIIIIVKKEMTSIYVMYVRNILFL